MGSPLVLPRANSSFSLSLMSSFSDSKDSFSFSQEQHGPLVSPSPLAAFLSVRISFSFEETFLSSCFRINAKEAYCLFKRKASSLMTDAASMPDFRASIAERLAGGLAPTARPNSADSSCNSSAEVVSALSSAIFSLFLNRESSTKNSGSSDCN